MKKLQFSFLKKIYVMFFLLVLPFSGMVDGWLNIEHFDFSKSVSFIESVFFTLQRREVLQFYILYISCALIASIIFIWPIIRFLSTGQNRQAAMHRILNAGYFTISNFIASVLAITLNNFLLGTLFSPITSLPLFIINTTLHALWLLVSSIAAYLVVLNGVTDVVVYIQPSRLEIDKFNLFSRFRECLLKILLFVLLSLVFIKLGFLLEHFAQNRIVLEKAAFMILMRKLLFQTLLILTAITLLIVIDQNIIKTQKDLLLSYLKSLNTTGFSKPKLPFTEKSKLGRLTVSISNFANYIYRFFSYAFEKNSELTQQAQNLKKIERNFLNFFHTQDQEISQFDFNQHSSKQGLDALFQRNKIQQNLLINVPSTFSELKSGCEDLQMILESIVSGQESAAGLTASLGDSVIKASEKSIEITNKIEDISKKVHEAFLETTSIEEVLQVIKNIAEQTKLLSMSASIEAAHGGASEAGFASVAEEIRKLAELSHNSVNSIAKRLETIDYLIHQSAFHIQESKTLVQTNMHLNENIKNMIDRGLNASREKYTILPILIEKTSYSIATVTKYQEFTHTIISFLQQLNSECSNEKHYSEIINNNFRNVVDRVDSLTNAMYDMDQYIDKIDLSNQEFNTLKDNKIL